MPLFKRIAPPPLRGNKTVRIKQRHFPYVQLIAWTWRLSKRIESRETFYYDYSEINEEITILWLESNIQRSYVYFVKSVRIERRVEPNGVTNQQNSCYSDPRLAYRIPYEIPRVRAPFYVCHSNNGDIFYKEIKYRLIISNLVISIMEIFLEWKKSNKIDFPTYSTTRRKNLQKYSTAKDTDFQYSFSPFDNILSFSLSLSTSLLFKNKDDTSLIFRFALSFTTWKWSLPC